jgi:hypothetical protein
VSVVAPDRKRQTVNAGVVGVATVIVYLVDGLEGLAQQGKLARGQAVGVAAEANRRGRVLRARGSGGHDGERTRTGAAGAWGGPRVATARSPRYYDAGPSSVSPQRPVLPGASVMILPLAAVALADDGVHTLAKGWPLMQVIPFARESERLEGTIRAESEQDASERERIYRSTLASEGWYRRQSRSKLRGNLRS